jgi:uncharacterized small protein (TIGR04563 family)
MTTMDKRKQSLYFPERMLDELRFEAARMDRSLSWVVQKAWKVARQRVMAMPSANEVGVDGVAVENGDRDADPNGE